MKKSIFKAIDDLKKAIANLDEIWYEEKNAEGFCPDEMDVGYPFDSDLDEMWNNLTEWEEDLMIAYEAKKEERNHEDL
jgi:hypothetical protein